MAVENTFAEAWSKGTPRSHHDNEHLKPQTNRPTMGQIPTPYSFGDIALTGFSKSRLLQQGQRSYQGHTMTMYTYTHQLMSPLSMNFLMPYSVRYSSAKILKVKVNMARSKVKFMSHHAIAHIYILQQITLPIINFLSEI